jgi:hypothetical protein
VLFVCDHGQSMTVIFEGQSARLESRTGTVHLAAQKVASGIHYMGEGHDLLGKGPEIVWTDPAGVKRSCRDQEWAMKQPQIVEPVTSLADTSWRFVHFQSSDDRIGTVVPPRVERYTMEFKPDGMVSLGLDCNRAMARWQATFTSHEEDQSRYLPVP